MSSLAYKLMAEKHACAIAPAGCGKTQTIVEMVTLSDHGKQLVLTHTHAGVQSLAKRFKKLKVSSSRYHLDTIASWSLRLANSYPSITKFSKSYPDADKDWKNILTGVITLLAMPFMRSVILASYSGVIVDEYQDCTHSQHSLIKVLATILPCRLLGDPLQGIFDLNAQDLLVNWEQDIPENFLRINHEHTPYRWKNKNTELGEWLLTVRNNLEANQSIDLRNAPAQWKRSVDNERIRQKNLQTSLNKKGTTIVIHPSNVNTNACHVIARHMSGILQSIEPMEAKDLFVWAKKLDNLSGGQRVVTLIEFASKCCTQISELDTIKDKFAQSDTPNFSRFSKHIEIAVALSKVANRKDFVGYVDILEMITNTVPNSYNYRLDLWNSMLQAFKFHETGNYTSLHEAAWHARQRQRIMGRKEYQRVIARTLLIKGLEYDHAILLDAHLFDRKNLYVALTRASQSLTIISDRPILNPIG